MPYTLQVGDPQTEGMSQLQKSSPRSEGSDPTSGFPAKETCSRKMSPQNIWLWHPAGRPRELLETETPLLKGTHRISHTASPSATCWSERDCQRGGKHMGLPLGTETPRKPLWGLLLLWWHQHWKVPFWNLPAGLNHQGLTHPLAGWRYPEALRQCTRPYGDPAPPNSRSARALGISAQVPCHLAMPHPPQKAGPLDHWGGGQPPLPVTFSCQPHHNRRTMQPTQEAPLEHTALETRGEYATQPHRTSPT